MAAETVVRHLTHWGAYEIAVRDGRIAGVVGFAQDTDPSPIGRSLVDGVDHPARVDRPVVRRGWLDGGPARSGAGRGAEPFVAVSWEQALDLVGGELDRVRRDHGNQAIYAGSYGWASAGRFHHAQSQIHRFLNLIGGYTASVNTYSLAAAEVIVPHVVGHGFDDVQRAMTSWPVLADHAGLIVSFGGIPLKNAQVNSGGQGRHTTRDWLARCRANGVDFVNIGPLRDDLVDLVEADWLAPRPNTDTAIMLGLAHTLLAEGLHDQSFLDRYCVGFGRLRDYLTGAADGQPKDADWAGAIAELDPQAIRALARRMAASRTMINVAWSVQRADHGEQPYWMAIALAAMLGQIGLPGGGFGFGYGAVGSVGNGVRRLKAPKLDRPAAPIDSAIPVARIADMLLNPGAPFDYDGRRLTYPDIRLVYWAGGNPFHHHQDINRLVDAWRRPQTIVVHEPFWTATARHADIVLPVTTPLERNDIGGSSSDNHLFAMPQAVRPLAAARNDYDIFSGLAGRLGVAEAFTEGRDEAAWLRHIYEAFRQQSNALPDFDRFWAEGHIEYPDDPPGAARLVLLADFRADPDRHPLPTPSGRIEVWSDTIDGFGYDDCPGHPQWMPPYEWLGGPAAERFPLHLISNQPATRLHSQYDHGANSTAAKIEGREPMRMNPSDAAARGIRDGDVVRVFNDRGACLAGAVVSDRVRRGVVQLSTGAWYDPVEPGRPGALDSHGNPNMLTRDKGTSRLAQGPTAQTTLVEVERWTGPVPPVTVFAPPRIVAGAEGAGG